MAHPSAHGLVGKRKSGDQADCEQDMPASAI